MKAQLSRRLRRRLRYVNKGQVRTMPGIAFVSQHLLAMELRCQVVL